MKTVSVKKNYIYNLLYQVFGLLVPLVTTPYVSRVLGPSGVGTFSYTYALAQYFVLFGNLGVATYGQMEIAKVRDDEFNLSRTFYELVAIRGGTTLISLSIYIITAMMAGTYRKERLILSIFVIASAIDISWLFQGIENFSKVVVRNLILKGVTVVLIFLIVKTPSDVDKYVFLVAFSTLLGNLSFVLPLKKILVKVSVKELKVKQHFSQCLVFFIPTIATSVYTILDKAMLGILTHDVLENGYYEQAHRIEQILITLITSLNIIMRSRMSYLYNNKLITEMHQRMDRSLSYILMLSLGMAGGLIGVAQTFIPLFLGNGFDRSIILLQIFSLLLINIGLSNCINTHYLGPSGRQNKNNVVLISGAAVNFLCNYISIPRYGAVGAAISSVIAEFLILCGYLYLARDFIMVSDLFRLGWKYFIAASMMTLFLLRFNFHFESLFTLLIIKVFIGGAIYFSLVFLLRDQYTIGLFKDTISKIKSMRNN